MNRSEAVLRLQGRARLIGALSVFIGGAWILHGFLGFMAWAVILAVATWPAYRRLSSWFGNSRLWSALSLTLLIALIIIAPLSYGFGRFFQEAHALGNVLVDAQHAGVAAPEWLASTPMIGAWLVTQWNDLLGSPAAAKETLKWLGTGAGLGYTKALASQVAHRVFGLFIMVMTLFFIYYHGGLVGTQLLRRGERLFGEKGVSYALHAMAAIRATVNGLVLVALGEGLLLGIGYAFSGLPHPTMLGVVTGIFALIPFAAKLIFGACALMLIAQGKLLVGVLLFGFGLVIILLADNYVRPLLIGGAVELPFMWTLLGILGGIENFGLLGLFMGPTVMAVLMSVWRDWVTEAVSAEPLPPEPG
ncbi:AI-2E family transporter [Candidatus Methylospira mobilis]|uniref:AI-2E family transporter n=1 Tax=Candidatus Methylospira mobilis TaxID=1808979 RepID=A0A5Q0BNR9_9GAMM|nr:AI-2E family transporter [Candidatus Methylospira mobilis]QFY43737.1 AI-2E family transporter [Candidatus Methylospira mobilis]WNV04724.1 AI-2E family transporter [Candidatus Methylospira mobilis]